MDDRNSFFVLGSGSRGNSVFVQSQGCRILLDCGLSAKRTREILASREIELNALDAILITHEHSDHVKGLAGILGQTRAPVMASRGTLRAISKVLGTHARVELKAGLSHSLGVVDIAPFKVNHDAADPLGFRVDSDTLSFASTTDLGVWTEEVVEAISGVDALVLEFNHDLNMLRRGPYPQFLKRRVSGRSGHLSNWQAARLLDRVASESLKTVVLAHMSEKNNTRELAAEAARAVVGDDVIVEVARQTQPTEQYVIGRASNPRWSGKQASLF